MVNWTDATSRHVHENPLVRFWQWGLDLLFPPVCVACNRAGQSFCDHCAQAVQPVPRPLCDRCGRPLGAESACRFCWDDGENPLTLVRAAALFDHPLRPAIHHLKYEGRTELAPLLSRYLVAAFQDADWQDLPRPVDGVVPVPLHAERLAERGYNQSALLAQDFGRLTRLPVYPEWLTRQRHTRPQVGLNAQERRQNVDDAFHAAAAVAGRTILLIDDVYTTGATLWACAAALNLAGARTICALTLAQPGLPDTPT